MKHVRLRRRVDAEGNWRFVLHFRIGGIANLLLTTPLIVVSVMLGYRCVPGSRSAFGPVFVAALAAFATISFLLFLWGIWFLVSSHTLVLRKDGRVVIVRRGIFRVDRRMYAMHDASLHVGRMWTVQTFFQAEGDAVVKTFLAFELPDQWFLVSMGASFESLKDMATLANETFGIEVRRPPEVMRV